MEKEVKNVRIRNMQVDDVDEMLLIDRKISGIQRAVTYSFDHILGGDFPFSFVAEENGNVIGFVFASVTYVPQEVTEACVIQTIGVDPDHRQQRVATKLIQTLQEESRSKGIKMVIVMVDQIDSQLKGFFESMGFQIGRFIEYYKTI